MRPPARRLLLAALSLCIGVASARAEGILVFGDSISVGGDDEPVPDDRCPQAGGAWGWPAALECRLRAQGDTRTWHRFAAGGTTSWWALAKLEQAIAAAPGATTAFLSFHVNDCSVSCGSVCAAGARAGAVCGDDSDCPGSSCDRSNAHACSAAEVRSNLRSIVLGLLAAGYERVIFWKSPGRIGGLELGHACAVTQFDGGPDSIDALFLVDPAPEGFADDPRVEFEDRTFRDFCAGSGLQGCDPDDGEGDRRSWWFAHDRIEYVATHIHPNGWGYMALAARLGERLTGAPLDRPPPRPEVALVAEDETSLSIDVVAPADPDGDPVVVYAWASCAETSGVSADPGCDRALHGGDVGPFLARECGAIAGADHDGGTPQRSLAATTGGTLVLGGLAPATSYRVCAVAWDGFEGSLLHDTVVGRTGGIDADRDGAPDSRDVCLGLTDPLQVDADLDGFGNRCDADFDGDGRVGLPDFMRFGRAFGASTGSPRYDASVDYDSDGVIGSGEFLFVSRWWLKAPGPSALACAGSPPCAAP